MTQPKITDEILYTLCINTTKILREREQQDKLQQIIWSNGEANLDTDYSQLACDSCCKAWDITKQKHCEYNEIKIVCKIPDINIIFIYPDFSQVCKKIELKSSKTSKMLGSTIKNLDINQPIIYCLRPKNDGDEYKIRCSQYHHAMGESNIDLFQDRTPRPIINFEKMKDKDNSKSFENKKKNYWVEHYANCAIYRIDNQTKCQQSWQDDMVKIMEKKIIEKYLRKKTIKEIEEDKLKLEDSTLI